MFARRHARSRCLLRHESPIIQARNETHAVRPGPDPKTCELVRNRLLAQNQTRPRQSVSERDYPSWNGDVKGGVRSLPCFSTWPLCLGRLTAISRSPVDDSQLRRINRCSIQRSW